MYFLLINIISKNKYYQSWIFNDLVSLPTLNPNTAAHAVKVLYAAMNLYYKEDSVC